PINLYNKRLLVASGPRPQDAGSAARNHRSRPFWAGIQGEYRPPMTGALTPWPGSSQTPAPPGFLSAPILASIRYGLPPAVAARTASARSPGRSIDTPSMPAERAMAAKSGL